MRRRRSAVEEERCCVSGGGVVSRCESFYREEWCCVQSVMNRHVWNCAGTEHAFLSCVCLKKESNEDEMERQLVRLGVRPRSLSHSQL